MSRRQSQLSPFSPNFGRTPSVFIDRSQLVSEIILGLGDKNSPYQTTLISGIRGCGKTALMADICAIMKEKKDWIVADLTSGENLSESLLNLLYNNSTSDIRKLISRLDGIKVTAFGIQVEYSRGDQLGAGFRIILENILKTMKKKGKSLLVSIDEVDNSEQMKEFASVYQLFIREDYPISLIMSGLPKNISALQNDKVLTFLLRSKRVDLEPLYVPSVFRTYEKVFTEEGFRTEKEALIRAARLTGGYAYAFQLLGYLLWKQTDMTIDDRAIDAVMTEYKNELFRNVYIKIYSELSGSDREMIKAVAQCMDADKSAVAAYSEVRSFMDKPAGHVATYRRRLIDSQLLTSPEHGQLAFTLPLFKDFIMEDILLFEE